MLSKNLPPYLNEISDFSDLLQAEQIEFDLIYNKILKAMDNTFIETSDVESIERLEKIFGINHKKYYSLRVRKDALQAKLRSNTTINEAELKRIALAFNCGDIEAKQVNNKYVIRIKFISIYGIPEGLEVFKNALKSVIPAHLDLQFIYSYLTWQEFDDYNKTWQQWDNLNLTWHGLEKYREV